MNPIRTLTAREIDCRVSQISKSGKGLQILLYKDARCDMAILDETFGPMGWQRHHLRDNSNCIVSIWDEMKQQWIDKEDTGTESNTEAEKGLASDSFKRACVNVGIGRELYTAPFIWIDAANCTIKQNDKGKWECRDRFEVSEIGYNSAREIDRLAIINGKTKNVVYTFGKPGNAHAQPAKPKAKETPAPAQNAPEKPAEPPKLADEYQKEYIRKNASDALYEALMAQYGADLENLTDEAAESARDQIDNNRPMSVTCERCGNPITGVAMKDGTVMNGAELVGKSKLKYGGVYCFNCMKELSKKRKAS